MFDLAALDGLEVTELDGRLAGEPFGPWLERQGPRIRGLPSDVAEQWLYENGKDARYIRLLHGVLNCKVCRLPIPVLLRDVFTADPPREPRHEAQLLAYWSSGFQESETWPRPPILYLMPTGFVDLQGVSQSHPYLLVEGHRRLRWLHLQASRGLAASEHDVWVLSGE